MSTSLGGAACCCFGFTQLHPATVRLRVPPARAADTSPSQSPARLRAVLEQVDEALSKGNDEAALSLVRDSQGEDGGLRGFGAARQMLNKFSCIALAGVATEYLLYGVAEGGLADINKLDGLLKGLGFTQKKADSQVRWAVLNTVLMLRHHEKARSQLADAMSFGKSVGTCIEVIEGNINPDDI
nr:unnamed protein product [Digitaria exilis]